MNEPVYRGHEFEALKMRYEDQIELHRMFMRTDLQIFLGYLTLQFALGAWLFNHPLKNCLLQCMVLFLDLFVSVLAGCTFYSHHYRRKQIVETIENLNEAFGFDSDDVYLENKSINAKLKKSLPLSILYIVGTILSFIFLLVISLIIFGSKT